MNGPPIPIEAIEQQAMIGLTEPPLFEAQDGSIPVCGLLDELDLLEQVAEDRFDAGEISRETRLGVLIAVAGLRQSICDASDGKYD